MLMPSWILAPLAALLLWLAVCAYLWLVRRRASEVHEGVRALSTMHWRDFSAVVLRVLQDQRGWQPTQLPQDGLPSAYFMMQTEHGTRLVACKHGRGYRIGVAAVNELGAMARLAGANGGVMVTEGRMEREGLAASEKQSIEVLDGARLWPLLKPYLPGDLEAGVVGAARRRAIQQSVIAGAALATLAVMAVLELRPPGYSNCARQRRHRPHRALRCPRRFLHQHARWLQIRLPRRQRSRHRRLLPYRCRSRQ